MTRRMRTSKVGFELIKSFEGFRARAKALPDGRWTIGYGHTQTARENLRITRTDAEAVLREYDLPPVELAVSEAVLAPLNQNEFDALVSFVFNIGEPAFLRSKMLAHLNSGHPLAAVDAMSNWRKAHVNGRLMVVDALVRRRIMEQALFLKHPSGQPIAPSTQFRPVRAATPVGPKPTPSAGLRPDQPPVKSTGPAMSASAETRPGPADTRLTREIDSPPSKTKQSAHAQAQAGPTPDEITRAISALANPEGDAALEPVKLEAPKVEPMKVENGAAKPTLMPPPFDPAEELPELPGVDYGEKLEGEDVTPSSSAPKKIIDDLEPAEIDPLLLEQAVAETEAGPRRNAGRGMFYIILGLIGLVLGAFGINGLRGGRSAVGLETAELDLYFNFAAITFGLFLILLALFLAFRARPKL